MCRRRVGWGWGLEGGGGGYVRVLACVFVLVGVVMAFLWEI